MFSFCCRLLFLKRIVFTESSVGIDEWHGSLPAIRMQQNWCKVGFDLKYFWSCRMRREILPKCFMCSTALHERQNHGGQSKGLAADNMGWDWKGKEKVIQEWRFFGFGWVVLFLSSPNISFTLLQRNVPLRNWVMFSFNKLTSFLSSSPVAIWSLIVLFLFPLAHIPDACVLFRFY